MSSSKKTIRLIHRDGQPPPDVVREVGLHHTVRPLLHADFLQLDQISGELLVIDAAGFEQTDLPLLARRLAEVRRPDQPVIIIVSRTSHALAARIGLLEGNNAVQRPLSDTGFAQLVDALLSRRAADGSPKLPTSSAEAVIRPEAEIRIAEASNAVINALDVAFNIGASMKGIRQESFGDSIDAISGALDSSGLPGWVESVREHHQSTYQHCLLVAGTTVAMGKTFGFSKRDMHRITTAAVLHDVGKARIPLAILDKPGQLTQEEYELMKAHTTIGHATLCAASGFDEEILDMVLSHHEMLDGSGYPHGLSSRKISDLVRVITIADIYAALIEKRSYKPPRTARDAVDIMLGMAGKLDMPLVRAQQDVLLSA